MKSKASKKLIFSLLILVVAVAVAATSTAAWFTMNDRPEIEEWEVTVTNGDGLYITLTDSTGDNGDTGLGKDGTFRNFISKADVEALLDANYQFAAMVPNPDFDPGEAEDPDTNPRTIPGFLRKALTHGTPNGKTKQIENPAYVDADTTPDEPEFITVADGTDATDIVVLTDAAGNLLPYDPNKETCSYTFRVYFRSSIEYSIALDMTNSAVTSAKAGVREMKDVQAWKAGLTNPYYDTDEDYNDGPAAAYALAENIAAHAANAARISFFDGTKTSVWNPNSGVGHSGADNANDTAAANLAYQYYNYMNLTQLAIADYVEPTYLAKAGTNAAYGIDYSDVLTTLTKQGEYYQGYLDITLWLEGWDAEAFNSILEDIINTTIKFYGIRA